MKSTPQKAIRIIKNHFLLTLLKDTPNTSKNLYVDVPAAIQDFGPWVRAVTEPLLFFFFSSFPP
ncbi:MAG: hypothetical protein ACE5NA_11455 [Nitrospiraceae bacterium]